MLGTLVRRSLANQLSTVHKGVAFEEKARRVLQEKLSMSLDRVGGKDDGGVDLTGWWEVASRTEGEERLRLRVVGQCKAEKKKLGPRHVRELEGSMEGDSGVVGMLVSESGFTASTFLRASTSQKMMMLVEVGASGDVGGLYCNRRLSAAASVEVLWGRSGDSGEGVVVGVL